MYVLTFEGTSCNFSKDFWSWSNWVSERVNLLSIYFDEWLVMLKLTLILMWCRVVESVGDEVTEIKKGDTVIPIFIADCEDCIDCKSTKSNLCSNFPFKISPWMPRYANTTRFTDLNGEIINHFMFVSSFSEYTVVDIANLLKIDPAIPPNRACLLSCGVSTGMRSTTWINVHMFFWSVIEMVISNNH